MSGNILFKFLITLGITIVLLTPTLSSLTFRFGTDSDGNIWETHYGDSHSFVIWQSGGTTYAKNTTNGSIAISSTNDSEVIQFAIDNLEPNYVAASGTHMEGTIYIKSGKYYITDTIEIGNDDIRIEGEDGIRTEFWAYGAEPIINIEETGAGDGLINSVVLKHLHLVCNETGDAAYPVREKPWGINITSGIYFIGEELIFDSMYCNIYLKDSQSCFIKNIISEKQNRTFYSDNSQKCVFTEITTKDQNDTSGLSDIRITSGTMNTLSDSNIFNTDGVGLQLTAGRNLVVSNLHIRNTTGNGIGIDNQDNSMLSGLMLYDADVHLGVDGIKITGDCENLSITDSMVTDYRYGIYLSGVTAKKAVYISGCNLRGCTTDEYRNDGTGFEFLWGGNVVDDDFTHFITNSNGHSYEATEVGLQSAIDDVSGSGGGTVWVGGDVTLTSTINMKKDVTLDCQGFNITINSDIAGFNFTSCMRSVLRNANIQITLNGYTNQVIQMWAMGEWAGRCRYNLIENIHIEATNYDSDGNHCKCNYTGIYIGWESNTGVGSDHSNLYSNTFRNIVIMYCKYGVYLEANAVKGYGNSFTFEDITIFHYETGFYFDVSASHTGTDSYAHSSFKDIDMQTVPYTKDAFYNIHGDYNSFSDITIWDWGTASSPNYIVSTNSTAYGTYFHALQNLATSDISDSGDYTTFVEGGGIYPGRETYGYSRIADGGTINHNLSAVPTFILVTPTVAGEMASVTARDGTTITVALKTHAGAAGTTQRVYWMARV